MNKTMFEENWTQIRAHITDKWSLIVEYDLNKIDKAEVKYDKFVTMLQVKYGYARPQAKEEVARLWAQVEAGDKSRA